MGKISCIPAEEIVLKMKKNKFVYDPENGGGRRRRIKKVSRFQMVEQDSEEEII